MIKHILITTALLQAVSASACVAQPTTAIGTVFCQAETASNKTPLTLMATSFCGDVQDAFTQALGRPVLFASEEDAEWAITIGVSAYRADALILHRPTAQTETLQFDIMDASLTPDRLRPFANDVASLAVGLRHTHRGDVKDSLKE